MLVLTRRETQDLLIGSDIVVRVVEIMGKQVRLGIEAPNDIKVDRREIRERKESELGGES